MWKFNCYYTKKKICKKKKKCNDNLEARNISRAGTLHVIQAQPRMYIKMINLRLFNAGNNGAKNNPSHTIPWLLIIWSTFSATLNSPYSGWNTVLIKSSGNFLFVIFLKESEIVYI